MRTTKELIKRLQDASPNEGSHDLQCLCFDAANVLTDLEQQVLERDARIEELVDALRAVGGPNYDAARVRLSTVVDKALSTTTPSKALQRALLEARIDALNEMTICMIDRRDKIVLLQKIDILRAQLAALGE